MGDCSLKPPPPPQLVDATANRSKQLQIKQGRNCVALAKPSSMYMHTKLDFYMTLKLQAVDSTEILTRLLIMDITFDS